MLSLLLGKNAPKVSTTTRGAFYFMAKRLTDSEKWKKPFIRGMKAPYKLLWLYILDECDHAGIWQVDFDVAQIKIGEKLNIEQAKIFFSGKIFEFDGGEKWYIPDFIEFQYGELNESNRAHSSVLRILKQYNLLDIKPLTSPLQGAKDMDKDKEMDKDKDKDKDKEADFDFPKSDLDIAFDNWVAMRKKMKGGITDHAIELGKKELQELSNGNANLAIAIINRSILNSWKGFFPLSNKNQNNGNSKADEREQLRQESIAILTGGKNN